MKLEGSLDAFSLPDIFQLLSFTKKSGGLHLASDGCDGVVFFAGGEVTAASSDSSRQPLARRLIGAGVVDDEALSAAVAAASSGETTGVSRALLDQGALDEGPLREAARDQSVDAIFDLLRWARGDFVFVVDEPNHDDVGVALPVPTVLADVESRQSAWDAVSQVVPSPQAVLTMPLVPPEDPQVSREEWSLLALVDGRRSVTELVDLTGSGQYAVVSTLAGLVTRGLLEVRDENVDASDHVAVVVRRQALLAPLEGTPFAPVIEQAAPVEGAQPLPPAPAAETGPAGESVAKTEPAADTTRPLVPAPAPAPAPDDVPDGDALVAAGAPDDPSMLGGAHVPGDVVPPRPEPFLPRRHVDFDESGPRASRATPNRPVGVPRGGAADLAGGVVGATAVALDPQVAAVIERDPDVNRSLMLRLIAGVRGL